MSKQSKRQVVVACIRCGNEVACSPGMAKYALGRGCCAVRECEGDFKLKDEKISDVPS